MARDHKAQGPTQFPLFFLLLRTMDICQCYVWHSSFLFCQKELIISQVLSQPSHCNRHFSFLGWWIWVCQVWNTLRDTLVKESDCKLLPKSSWSQFLPKLSVGKNTRAFDWRAVAHACFTLVGQEHMMLYGLSVMRDGWFFVCLFVCLGFLLPFCNALVFDLTLFRF